jgi:hypothetical protein
LKEFLLTPRFHWKNQGQDDEKAGKTAQLLSKPPPGGAIWPAAGFWSVDNSR